MNSSKINRSDFWNKKIINWEKERYDGSLEQSSVLEKLASNASNSLRYRHELTKKIITQNCNGKTVAEIGCGTGRLVSPILNAGAKHYYGYDISKVAIKEAITAQKNTSNTNTTFTVADIDMLPSLDVDIVFSIGLVDWLNNDEIRTLFIKSGKIKCLHSFSEIRLNAAQILHRLYVKIAYGYQTKHYVPRYLNYDFLKDLAETHSKNKIHIIRDKRLSFGAFISSLPEG